MDNMPGDQPGQGDAPPSAPRRRRSGDTEPPSSRSAGFPTHAALGYMLTEASGEITPLPVRVFVSDSDRPSGDIVTFRGYRQTAKGTEDVLWNPLGGGKHNPAAIADDCAYLLQRFRQAPRILVVLLANVRAETSDTIRRILGSADNIEITQVDPRPVAERQAPREARNGAAHGPQPTVTPAEVRRIGLRIPPNRQPPSPPQPSPM